MEFMNSYADLASYSGTDTQAYVAGNGVAVGNGTLGNWVLDASIGASVAPNIGTHQRDAAGRMWRRDFYGDINPLWFQSAATDDPGTVLQRALNASVSALINNGVGIGTPVCMQGSGVWQTAQQIVVPQFASLITRGGRRTAIVNYDGTDGAFLIENADYTTLRGFRIGLSQQNAGGIKVHAGGGATSRWGDIRDIEIAGTNGKNQYGLWMYIDPNSTSIITENIAFGINTFEIDRPEIRSGTEGNFNLAYSYDSAGCSGNSPVLINRASHAEFTMGRVAGRPNAGFTGMQENGARNTHLLVVDCGPSGRAMDVEGVGNTMMVQRPELLTPLGAMVQQNQFFGEMGGWMPTASQFTLNGWGANAHISELRGDNQCVRVAIQTVSGDTISANPTVQFSFRDGVWSGARQPVVTRDGGNDATIGACITLATTNGWQFTYNGTPTPGGLYVFTIARV